MPKSKKKLDEDLRVAPAETMEARENQLIAESMDLAEKQIIEGTASAQVITHFLKLGTTRAVLENEKLKSENDLLKAKIETLQSQQRSEELYQEALNAMRRYSGDYSETEEVFDD